MVELKKECRSANHIRVRVTGNGPQGGDAGHGGRAFVEINGTGSTDWEIVVRDANGETHHFDQPVYVRFLFAGDCEMQTGADALTFAGQAIEEMGQWNADVPTDSIATAFLQDVD